MAKKNKKEVKDSSKMNLNERERMLADKYDKHCHDYKTNHGFTIWLNKAFKFGEKVTAEDLEFEYMDEERMEISGFYTWGGQIIGTDGCGDCEIKNLLSDSERERFLEYISDENNLKFEH